MGNSDCTPTRRHEGTTARRYDCTKVRLHDCTKARLHEGTTARLHEGTTSPLFSISYPLVCIFHPLVPIFHPLVSISPHPLVLIFHPLVPIFHPLVPISPHPLVCIFHPLVPLSPHPLVINQSHQSHQSLKNELLFHHRRRHRNICLTFLQFIHYNRTAEKACNPFCTPISDYRDNSGYNSNNFYDYRIFEIGVHAAWVSGLFVSGRNAD